MKSMINLINKRPMMKVTLFLACCSSIVSSLNWFMDNGCSNHITSKLVDFISLDQLVQTIDKMGDVVHEVHAVCSKML